MDHKGLIAKLNWFYSLELNQVDFYSAQARCVKDIYLSKTLTRVASIEQQHVDNMAAWIKNLGGRPTVLGDVISPLLGKTIGYLTGALGPEKALKVGITLEEKAMQDYKNLIMRVGEKELFNTLWDNLIDEDLHAAWFSNKLAELNKLPI